RPGRAPAPRLSPSSSPYPLPPPPPPLPLHGALPILLHVGADQAAQLAQVGVRVPAAAGGGSRPVADAQPRCAGQALDADHRLRTACERLAALPEDAVRSEERRVGSG